MTDSSLVRWTPAQGLQLAREFVKANAGERRRQAARAVAERDREALWLVTRAYLTAHQRSGRWMPIPIPASTSHRHSSMSTSEIYMAAAQDTD